MTAHSCGNTSICVCWLGNFDDASSLSMVYRYTSLDRTLSRRVNVSGSERYVLIDDLDTQTNYSIYFEQYGGCAKSQTSEPVFVVTGENGMKCYSCALVQYAFPPFFGGGGVAGRFNFAASLTLLSRLLPLFFLSFLPLSLFLYRNIMHCCVISPISPASHPFRTPHPLPFLSRTLLLPPPIIPGSPPLSSATLFFSQFRLSNLLWRTSIPSRRSGYNQVSSPYGCNCPFAAISAF